MQFPRYFFAHAALALTQLFTSCSFPVRSCFFTRDLGHRRGYAMGESVAIHDPCR